MADPLVHLLRNAVDHGLETPEVRLALGKPAARHDPPVGRPRGQPGRPDASPTTAAASTRTRSGPPPSAAGWSPRTRPPCSPARNWPSSCSAPGSAQGAGVSELSGRGVGLDVVKSKVEALKGTVTVASTVGRGTTFTIRLPMTLAVARALLRPGRTGRRSPSRSTRSSRSCGPSDGGSATASGATRCCGSADAVYPVVPSRPAPRGCSTADDAGRRGPRSSCSAPAGSGSALVVDHLVGGREVVIKTLGPHLQRVPAVSGATLLGDGSVVLILNPAELHARPAVSPGTTAPRPPRSPRPPAAGRTVLVVDDSPSVRRVLTDAPQRSGWTPVTAKDGMEALEILQRGALPGHRADRRRDAADGRVRAARHASADRPAPRRPARGGASPPGRPTSTGARRSTWGRRRT